MPWISRRTAAETAAAMTRLRDQVAELRADVAEQGRANGRLARHAGAAEASLTVEAAALRSAHAATLERCRRLEQLVDTYRTANRGLTSQLEHALGYTAEEIAMLDAGVSTR